MSMSEPERAREIIRDGDHVKEVLSVLAAKKIDSSSLLAITERAAQILERSVDPIAGPPEQPSDGLLYGLIQSGKTSVIQVAAAMAADNGFQCIVILTSDIDLLYEQTLGRMKSALQGLMVTGKNDWKEGRRFERFLRNPPLVIVCSKNGSKLGSLLEAFKAAGARGLSALIIDDEADQASLNTYTSKGNDHVSRINEVISDFRNFFRVNTYLQVTATPQALFLQDPTHRYRPSFSVLTEPGAGYVGGRDFFGDPENRLLKFVDIEEVNELAGSHQPSPTTEIPRGLKEALLLFFVGATARKIKSPTKRFAFLCHVSMKKINHEQIVNLIERFRENMTHTLKDQTSGQRQQLIDELHTAYNDLMKTQVGLPPFEQIVEKVSFYLPGANVKLVNSTTGEEITLDAVFNIFVGGNKLGRGVTIDNLLVSYYGRNPKKPNADTVLQHARMYGYRQEDLGVTRLFLPEKLAGHFAQIHEMEDALRDLVAKYPEGKFEILYISSPLQATRRNVLDPNSLVAYVAGESINPTYPLRTPEVLELTRSIDEEVKNIGDYEEGKPIKYPQLLSLLERCPVDPASGSELWNLKTIRTALETLNMLTKSDEAHLVIRRNRNLDTPRGERKGIISDASTKESALAPKDTLTLFLYRQNATKRGEVDVWWPQLRFPEGQRNYVLSFSIDREDESADEGGEEIHSAESSGTS